MSDYSCSTELKCLMSPNHFSSNKRHGYTNGSYLRFAPRCVRLDLGSRRPLLRIQVPCRVVRSVGTPSREMVVEVWEDSSHLQQADTI
jgi:hypothetical protein